MEVFPGHEKACSSLNVLSLLRAPALAGSCRPCLVSGVADMLLFLSIVPRMCHIEELGKTLFSWPGKSFFVTLGRRWQTFCTSNKLVLLSCRAFTRIRWLTCLKFLWH